MVLVTGGTGLLGSHLLYELCTKKTKVRAIYRSESALEKAREVFRLYGPDADAMFSEITWVPADITSHISLEPCFKAVHTVYHCAALISFDPSRFRELQEVNVVGTANMVNLSLHHGVQNFCHVSSIAALGRPVKQETLIDETTTWDPQKTNPYSISKYLSEMEVWRGIAEGLNAVIVNPGIILGAGFWDSGSGRLFKRSAKSTSYYPPGLAATISVTDTVKVMQFLLENKHFGERYILVAQQVSYKSLLEKISKCLGSSAPKKEIPVWVLNILWRLDWFRSKLSGNERELTRDVVRGLKQPVKYNSEKIHTVYPEPFQKLTDYLPRLGHLYKMANS